MYSIKPKNNVDVMMLMWSDHHVAMFHMDLLLFDWNILQYLLSNLLLNYNWNFGLYKHQENTYASL